MTCSSTDKPYITFLFPQPLTCSSSLQQAVKLAVRDNEVGQVFVANFSMLPRDTFWDFNKVFG